MTINYLVFDEQLTFTYHDLLSLTRKLSFALSQLQYKILHGDTVGSTAVFKLGISLLALLSEYVLVIF